LEASVAAMENSTGIVAEQAPAPLAPAAPMPATAIESNGGVTVAAPSVEVAALSNAKPSGNPTDAGELIFKVANAIGSALLQEASSGSSPVPATPSPDKVRSKVQASPHTPQKQRGYPSSTPQRWPRRTQAHPDDLDDLGDCDGNYELGDDDASFMLSTPSPGGSLEGSPLQPYGGNGKGARSRRAWPRHDDNESRSAIARRAMPRAMAPAHRESRPPLPPPHGSLKALPAEHVQKFLKLVQDGDYSEALRALRKVRRAVKGRGCSKEAFGGMRALLHHLLEGFASANRLEEALNLLQNMKNGTEARLVSAAAFNALLRGLLSRGALEEARYVVRQEMVRMQVSPNEGSLNLLMDTAARGGPDHTEEAWDVLEEMQNRALKADKYTVSILTKSICERGDKRRVPRGVQLVERFLRDQPDDVDEVLVNSLLDVFCRMSDMPRLEATLVKMREYGIRGSAVTYGTIVKAYGKAGNIDKVLQAWQEMGRLGLEANAVTYGCMLDACVKCGHLDKALHVFQTMKDQHIHRNTILYATLIKGFAKSKDPAAARKLHEEMLREGVTCNVVVFNSLIDACVRAADLQGAAEVLQQMTGAGVKPDLITFSTLIKGYCSSGELGKAMRLADELRARDLECDEIVYNSLLEGCVKAGDLQLGLKLFEEMRLRQVRPSSVTFSILVKLLSRAGRLDLACHLVAREMREMHAVVPTRMVWSCLVTCCVKQRDLTRAVMVLDLLDRDGGATGSARTSMFATVIEGCLTQGEVGIALALCERAYSRVPLEEGIRGILSADLLRRIFEAVGSRGPEAEARSLLDSIASRLSEQVRSSLEEALSRGARRRSPQAGLGGRDVRGSVPRVGVSEASSIASMGADALLNPASITAWNGGVVAAAAQQQWPANSLAHQPSPFMAGSFQGMEAQTNLNNLGMNMWDPANTAALAAAATQFGMWPNPPQVPGMPPGMPGSMGMPGMPGMEYGFNPYAQEQLYNPALNPYMQYGQTWDDGSINYAAMAAAATATAAGLSAPGPLTGTLPGLPLTGLPAPVADLGFGAVPLFPAPWPAQPIAPVAQEVNTGALLGQVQVADTPKPCAETPSTASGGGNGTVERTPATTTGHGSPVAEEDNEKEQDSPVNMRLFAAGSETVTKDGDKGTPMRVEVPLSALLDGPPGLHSH